MCARVCVCVCSKVNEIRDERFATNSGCSETMGEQNNCISFEQMKILRCGVCFLLKEAKSTFSPCGHSICDKCLAFTLSMNSYKVARVDKCPFCRTRIEGGNRFLISVTTKTKRSYFFKNFLAITKCPLLTAILQLSRVNCENITKGCTFTCGKFMEYNAHKCKFSG